MIKLIGHGNFTLIALETVQGKFGAEIFAEDDFLNEIFHETICNADSRH
jgi:hypothetical protein